MTKRRVLFSVLTILVLLAICACMMIIGRGHTVYFDNKKLELEDGTTYDTVRRINVFVGGEQIAKLSKKERGMATCMGQSFKFNIEVIREKDADPELYDFSIKLPYNMDGIVLNLNAMIEGAAEDVYRSEFIPTPAKEEEEPVPGETDEMGGGLDEFSMGDDV